MATFGSHLGNPVWQNGSVLTRDTKPEVREEVGCLYKILVPWKANELDDEALQSRGLDRGVTPGKTLSGRVY